MKRLCLIEMMADGGGRVFSHFIFIFIKPSLKYAEENKSRNSCSFLFCFFFYMQKNQVSFLERIASLSFFLYCLTSLMDTCKRPLDNPSGRTFQHIYILMFVHVAFPSALTHISKHFFCELRPFLYLAVCFVSYCLKLHIQSSLNLLEETIKFLAEIFLGQN